LSFMRALAGTLLLGVVASVVYRRMPLPAGTHPVLHLLVAFVFGGMAYVLLQMALGWKELIRLRSLFKREKGAGGGGIQLAE
jgi:hypothetical protein